MANDNLEVTSGVSVDVIRQDAINLDVISDNTVIDATQPSVVEVYPDKVRVDLYTLEGKAITNPFLDATKPPAPFGLIVTPGFSSVHLAWDFTEYSNHKHTEIFRSIINDRNTATLVGTATGRGHTDSTNANTTYYYWLRNVSLSNELSDWNTTVGTSALTGQNGESLQDTLQGIISESMLTTALKSRIDLTDLNAAAILQEVSDRQSAIVTEGNNRTTEINLAIGQEVINRDTAILAAIDSEAANTSALIAAERQVRIDAEGVLATAIDTVSTTVDGNTASIQTQATSIDGLEAQYTVKVDVNGRVAGYGIATSPAQADGTESEFTVLADKFSILHPNATDPTNPELVFTVSGGKTVMDAAYIINLTVTDADITSLSANKITAGTMTAVDVQSATFKTSTSGGRVEVRDSDDSVTVYNSSNQIVAQLRSSAGGGGAIRAYGRASDDLPIYATHTSVIPTCQLFGNSMFDGGVLRVKHEGTATGDTAGTFMSGNDGSSYTKAYVCTGGTTASGAYAFWSVRGGYYDASGTGYLPFTGCHEGLLLKTSSIEEGDIVVDKDIFHKSSLSDVICLNDVSSSPNQKSVVGVFKKRTPFTEVSSTAVFTEECKYLDPNGEMKVYETTNPELIVDIKDSHDLITFNSVGEGQVNVCGLNGNIEIGDLIVTSAIPGKGMRQADDIVRSYTVAKAREAVSFSTPDEVKMIACIYLCG